MPAIHSLGSVNLTRKRSRTSKGQKDLLDVVHDSFFTEQASKQPFNYPSELITIWLKSVLVCSQQLKEFFLWLSFFDTDLNAKSANDVPRGPIKFDCRR